MKDFVVVGGGLFGSIMAKALAQSGATVELVTDFRSTSGSFAAGCLMKPTWLQKMGKENTDNSFKLLDSLYGLKTVELNVGPAKVSAYWINPEEIVQRSGEARRVTSFWNGGVALSSGQLIEARHVIIATGSWARELVPSVDVIGKVGLSVRLDEPPEDNRIKVWAPYKQLVRFSKNGFHWAGDGSAIIEKNWDGQRFDSIYNRISSFAGNGRINIGVRPYALTTDPALLQKIAPNVWCLTGGGKNGTAAAGWAAHEFLRRV